ncbi:GNAT family N-acetyltransferase [Dryocola clanedunensis]|uniref:GNAT family N-acetyltransferase n=1 Tax=Cedecea sulfonylureivorans TaxID=3051154 RepID=UPI001926E100|nr:GNAT family N-acetyltransferase [Cedecea sulfonylureivorans]
MKIVALNAATLPIYYRELATLLLDSMASGASVGYQQPLSREEAENTFYRLRSALDKGELLMWIARDEQGLVGFVRLELCLEPDGLNRAVIKSLLVHRRARRRGIAKQLITALEKAALANHRGLISLDIQAGTPAEAFYRAQGYRCLGELPDYLRSQDGYYHPAVIYYKRLFAVNQVIRAIAG